MNDRLMTPSEVSDVLGVTPESVAYLDRSGQLRATTRTQGGHRRFRAEDVYRYKYAQSVVVEFAWEEDEDEEETGGVDENGVERTPHHFHTKSTDERGHYNQAHIKYPPPLSSRIAKVANHPATPFRYPAEVWRDAMWWYLDWVEEWLKDPVFSESMEQIRLLRDVYEAKEEAETRQELLESTVANLQMAMDTGSEGRIMVAVAQAREVIKVVDGDVSVVEEAVKEALEKFPLDIGGWIGRVDE